MADTEEPDMVLEIVRPWLARVRAGRTTLRLFIGPRADRRAFRWCQRYDWVSGLRRWPE